MVLALSCFIATAWAQENTQQEQKPAKADNNSLDGKTYKVTLTARTDARTSSSQDNAINKSGINTGTIEQGSTQSGQPVYKSESTTQIRTATPAGTDQSGSVTVTDQKTTVDQNTTVVGTEQQGTVYTKDNTQMRREDGTFKDQPVTDQTTITQETATTVQPVDMNKETIVITFDDGMMQTDKFNTAWEDEKDDAANLNNTENVNRTENMNNTDINRTENMNNTENRTDNMTGTDVNRTDMNTVTAPAQNLAAGEPFAECPYTVTSGSGALSTFSVRCVDGTGTKGTAYWNGFINGSTISGNVVVFEVNGTSSRYSFTGKATKDSMRKATSSK